MLKYIVRNVNEEEPKKDFEVGFTHTNLTTHNPNHNITIEFLPNGLHPHELYELLLQLERGEFGYFSAQRFHFDNIIRLIAAELERLYLFHSQLTINEIEYGEVIEWAKRLHELHYEMEENLNGSQ